MNAKPMFVHCCHCTECQRQSGSAFAINALVESKYVELVKGETVEVNLPTESGAPHPAIRCGACGITLWSHYGGRRAVSFVRVGTLDKARQVRLKRLVAVRMILAGSHGGEADLARSTRHRFVNV